MSGKILRRLATTLAAVLALPAAVFAQAHDKGPELDQSKDYFALIVTTKGNIILDLYEDKTPITVQNFVNLAEGTAEFTDPSNGKIVKRPYYNGVQFHRVIPEFMIQGGDPQGTGRGGPGFNIVDEFVPEINFTKPGLLAMANTGRPGTGGSQFFITEAEPTWLNQKHTIFGEILPTTNGLDVVKEIARVDRGAADKPKTPVLMERVEIFRLERGMEAADVAAKILAGGPAEEATEEAPKPTEAPAEEAAAP